MEKLIITAAICGAEVTKASNPAVPYTVEEMVREAKSAYEAGAAILHIHVRNDDGTPTQDQMCIRDRGKGVYSMHEELIRRLNETKTMSIVGMCKNAGKTTMLNWLLTGGHLRGTLGLTSIGRDGESTDVVTGTEKPGIFVREGTLIATAKDMLRLGDVTKEILMTTGIPTPLGEVVILRARSAGYVQLAGPSITLYLIHI